MWFDSCKHLRVFETVSYNTLCAIVVYILMADIARDAIGEIRRPLSD